MAEKQEEVVEQYPLGMAVYNAYQKEFISAEDRMDWDLVTNKEQWESLGKTLSNALEKK